jgi:hypothetical protein
MSDQFEALNAWHLQLSIVADAIGHVLRGIEEPEGESAVAWVLRERLADLVESCPFPEPAPARIVPVPDFDLDDIDDGLTADLDGVQADLLTGGRDD